MLDPSKPSSSRRVAEAFLHHPTRSGDRKNSRLPLRLSSFFSPRTWETRWKDPCQPPAFNIINRLWVTRRVASSVQQISGKINALKGTQHKFLEIPPLSLRL